MSVYVVVRAPLVHVHLKCYGPSSTRASQVPLLQYIDITYSVMSANMPTARETHFGGRKMARRCVTMALLAAACEMAAVDAFVPAISISPGLPVIVHSLPHRIVVIVTFQRKGIAYLGQHMCTKCHLGRQHMSTIRCR